MEKGFKNWLKENQIILVLALGLVMILGIVWWLISEIFQLSPKTTKLVNDFEYTSQSDVNWRQGLSLEELIMAYSLFTPTGSILDAGAATEAAETEQIYKVIPGDTLNKIAIKFYGTPNGFHTIAAANKLKSPDRIEAGQILIIPIQ